MFPYSFIIISKVQLFKLQPRYTGFQRASPPSLPLLHSSFLLPVFGQLKIPPTMMVPGSTHGNCRTEVLRAAGRTQPLSAEPPLDSRP